ncbi:hypothetical protein ACPUER_12065 [Burkholderia sp. DN3021]|uniref:hypothetical protein n=1 Tax=Burkholderia sp. DN3021 TaxID=3410137 RepID=UPI003C7AD957
MSKNQKFKAGDRVQFTTEYFNAKVGDRGTVLDHDGDRDLAHRLYDVVLDKGGKTVCCFNHRFIGIREGFAEGDRVEFVEHYNRYSPAGSQGTVKRIPPAVAVEAEPQPEPVTFRICVNGAIGTTEYATDEAAKQAGLQHGDVGEEFAIFEVVKVSSFRVQKVLEAR